MGLDSIERSGGWGLDLDWEPGLGWEAWGMAWFDVLLEKWRQSAVMPHDEIDFRPLPWLSRALLVVAPAASGAGPCSRLWW